MKTFALIGAAALLCACASCPPPQSVALAGTEWIATEIGGAPPVEGATATVNFGKDGRISGGTGCNRYFGSYTIEETNLKIDGAGATKMACMQAGVMEQESKFLSIVSALARYERRADGTLLLTANDGRTIALAPAVK